MPLLFGRNDLYSGLTYTPRQWCPLSVEHKYNDHTYAVDAHITKIKSYE